MILDYLYMYKCIRKSKGQEVKNWMFLEEVKLLPCLFREVKIGSCISVHLIIYGRQTRKYSPIKPKHMSNKIYIMP
jgi:hypothetical protein